MDIDKAKLLIKDTSTILQKQKEYLKESGEDFNIFSITKIERYENNTHSAMIAELLDPKGSHHQGTLFLDEFLKVIYKKVYPGNETKSTNKANDFLKSRPRVTTEFHTGAVTDEVGGRLDILITSDNSRIIIENKVDAKDGKNQLIRYEKFSNSNDTLLYLTKFGGAAHSSSAGELKYNEDYFGIAYNEEIINWLENSLNNKLLKNQFVKFSTIQYLNIVKKITYKLEKKHMDDLSNLIKSNLEEASAIAANVEKVKMEIIKSFRFKVFTLLNKEFPKVKIDGKIVQRENGISIKKTDSDKIYFSLQGFDRIDSVYIGIYNENAEQVDSKEKTRNQNSAIQNKIESQELPTLHFPVWQRLNTPSKNNLNFNSNKILMDLHNDKSYMNNMLQSIVNQIKEFIETYNQVVLEANENCG